MERDPLQLRLDDAKVRITIRSSGERDPLQLRLEDAAKAGDLQGIIDAIADGADPGGNCAMAMQVAAAEGKVDCLRHLLSLKDTLQARDAALQWAATQGHKDCVLELLPVSDPLAFDSIALRWAAEKGHIECVRILLPHSDIDAARRVFASNRQDDMCLLLDSISQEESLKGKLGNRQDRLPKSSL